MRTKLFGALVAALAIAAFAALPSAAMAVNVTLKEGKTTVPVETTLRATSTNTVFKARPNNLEVKCATTAIRGKVRENPGVRRTFREGGRFLNAAGEDRCKVEGSGGRLEVRVENVKFRTDLTLNKNGTKVEGRTEARFTFRFVDRLISKEPVAGCSYEGKIKVTGEVGTDKFHAESEEDAKLEKEPVPPNFGNCEPEGFITGDFRLTRRDGTTAVTTN